MRKLILTLALLGAAQTATAGLDIEILARTCNNCHGVNGVSVGNQSLTIDAANGAVALAVVGNGVALQELTVTTSGPVTLGGNISTSQVGGGSGNVSFTNANGGITLLTDVTITSGNGAVLLDGSDVSGNSPGNRSLSILAGTGNVALNSIGTANALDTLTVDSSGTVTLNGNITTNGDVDFDNSVATVVLLTNVDILTDFDSSGFAGDVLFHANSTINGAFTLDIDAMGNGSSGGNVVLGTVGDTAPLANLFVCTEATVTLFGNISVNGGGNVDFVTSTGNIVVAGNITIDTDAAGNSTDAGDIIFTNVQAILDSANGTHSLTLDTSADGGGASGNVVALTTVGSPTQALANLTVITGSNSLAIDSNITVTNRATFNGNGVAQANTSTLLASELLLLGGSGAFTFDTATNDIGTIAGNVQGGSIRFGNDVGNLSVGTVGNTTGIRTGTGIPGGEVFLRTEN